MIRTPRFDRMSLAAGGHIRTALLDEHRVLTCMADRSYIFVIAHTDDTDRARQEADRLHTAHEGLRGIYLILVTDEQMTAIADPGVVLNVAVLLVAKNYETAARTIRLYSTEQITVTTEHGKLLTELTTTRELRTGDVYSAGVRHLTLRPPAGRPAGRPARVRDHLLYRARADYNPQTGWVEHHMVEPGYNPKPGERTGALTDGPNQIVFRILEPASLITRLNLDDLQGLRDT